MFQWWRSQKKFKRIVEDMGLNDEQAKRLKMSLAEGGDTVLQTIQEIQHEQNERLKASGTDYGQTPPIVGNEIRWNDIPLMVFRVLDFDRSDTVITGDGTVKAATTNQPYGFLLIESPVLNQQTILPVIHKDDYTLASSVFDEPRFAEAVGSQIIELLVTYAPKRMNKNGFSATPHHAFHYALVPPGTLERYYSDTPVGTRRMSNPEPQLIFGDFVYEGYIKVLKNPHPNV